MDFMFDWEAEGDRFSFEDSDRFEEDSLCSWISEPESLCNNWRGWRKQNGGQQGQLLCAASLSKHEIQSPTPLVELGAQAVACYIPFEVVEHFYPPIPELLQLRIAFWSFPENEEDIRLYSCLANGSADEFQKGEHLFKARAVKDALQIGFHLSATVIPPQTLAQAKGAFNVAVVFDRRRITSCNCTCSSSASWCAHVVALCLFRIHQATAVCLRAPVSESLSRLHRDQLQKFAQYLISELPQQILPTAQRLLDELLSSQQTAINTVCGAPDPTAGPSASEQTSWCLDELTLHENIKKTLIKFCVPSPIVFSDVNYLSSTAPPAAAEWQSLLRPLRGREPEGMWNLLSIVREMFRRNDTNAIPLLEILTEEVLACEQILVWWFTTKISASHNSSNGHSSRGNQNSSSSSQHAASSLCDEIVTLWRLSALNPALSPIQRDDLCQRFRDWHIKTIDKVRKGRGANTSSGASVIKKSDVEIFPGFKPSIEATQLDWSDYVIPEVTYVQKDRPRWRFNFNIKSQDGDGRKKGKGPTPTSGTGHKMGLEAALVQAHQIRQSQESNTSDFDPGSTHTDGACSSSSEGFCENDRLDSVPHDSDSDMCDLDIHCKKPSCNKVHHGLRTCGGMALHGSSLAMPRLEGCKILAASGAMGGASTSHQDYTREAAARLQLPSGSKAPKPGDDLHEAALGGATAKPGNQSGAAADGDLGAAGAAAVVKGEHSESQQSSDEYQVYFYDTKAKLTDNAADKKKKNDEPNYFAGIKKIENKQDVSILFARAEALHAHGHTREACKLAKQLAEEMLANPPDLTTEPPPHPSGKGTSKKKKSQNNISSFASTTLAKAAFLCSVLLEDPECHHLAFKVGMFGLEMPRPPASSKALEVKLAHQESELVGLLKRIPLGAAELGVIRDRAEKLRDGKLKSRGEALLPLTLASFIFDSLCLPVMCPVNGNSRPPSRSLQLAPRNAADEKLGFEAAVAALGLKANVSEADHPLLCEGNRRQRGDLAIAMLVHYKDDQVKLSKVMDKLLDKEVHQLYKAPSLTNYLSSSANASAAAAAAAAAAHAAANSSSAAASGKVPHPQVAPKAVPTGEPGSKTTGDGSHRKTPSSGCDSDDSLGAKHGLARSKGLLPNGPAISSGSSNAVVSSSGSVWSGPRDEAMDARAQSLDYLNLEQKFSLMTLHAGGGARPKTSMLCRYSSKDTDSSAVEEDGDNPDYKAWEAKFRCTNLKGNKKPSVGMAAIDSSAPETTSSDNSPTLVRRNWTKHQGPGSDSGSSGKSSDSLGSSSSGDKGAAAKIRDNESPPGVFGGVRFAPHLIVDSRSSTPNIKGARFKGKNRVMPTVPNQPSEASAHFMFELAKTVLTKAGGNSSTSLFTQPATSTSHTGPHRALHLCAFQIGLYALGLHNCVSPNWLSRTYSSHVSWITGQAMEIGSAAINILIDTWEGHLTPPEVASLADRASRGRDPNMVRAAAELALSCLPHAHALNPNEIQRALIQCKEQSREMLERACSAVEIAAKGGGVYPEVLFDVAKRWYELYEESMQTHGQGGSRGTVVAVVQPDIQVQAQAQAQVQAQALVPIAGAQAVVVETSQPVMQLVPCQVAAQSVAAVQQGAAAANGAPIPTAMAVPPIPYTIPPPAPSHPQLPHHPYIAPYSYVQQMPPNFGHHYSQPHIPLHTHSMHPSYMATYPYNGQTAFTNVPHLQNLHPNPATLYHANVSHLRPPPPTAVQITYTSQPAAGGQQAQLSAVPARGAAPGQLAAQKFHQVAAVEGQVLAGAAVAVSQAANVALQQQDPSPGQQVSLSPAQNSVQMNCLMAAYRVGMLAMETLARRVHDDRPQTKYARNPPYGEDVKWLLAIAMKLGTSYLQQFCASAVNAVVSPFVLQDIALESAHFLARNNPTQVSNQLRSPTLNSLVQKCLQMFIQCTHQRMHHITQAEYEEFVGIVCSARNAFCMTPGGMVQFNELLQSLRRSKSCKKELWQRIVNGLATGSI